MKVLFDTNVVLDVLLRREPFYRDAARLFVHLELQHVQGYLGATTVTTLAYFLEKTLRAAFLTELRRRLELFDVATIDKDVLSRAQMSSVKDFEDAVLAEAAFAFGLDAIVTRNGKDFENAALPALAPQELLAVLDARR